MAEDSGREHDEHKRVQRAEQSALPTSGELAGGMPASSGPAYSSSLLGDSRLNGRGNQPVKVAVMRRAQQIYGNRAVQRFLHRSGQAGPSGGTQEGSKDTAFPAPSTSDAAASRSQAQRTPVQRQNGGGTTQAAQTLADKLRTLLAGTGPPDVDAVLAAIHAAPVAERQAVLNDAGLRTLINDRLSVPPLSPENATIAMSSLMEGSQQWKNPPSNDFHDYFVTKNGNGTLPNTATMNCWESIMYAAYLSGRVSAQWVRDFYTNALSAGGNTTVAIWAALGWSTSLPRYSTTPGNSPRPGQLLYYISSGAAFPDHVALSLGGDKAMSLWNQPNNNRFVQQINVTDLSGDVHVGNPPW